MTIRTACVSSVVCAGILLAAANLSGVAAGRRQQANPAPPAAETVRLPTGLQVPRSNQGPMRTEVDFSPDGRSIVFSASPDGSMEKTMLHLRSLDRPDAAVIPGTTGACMPSFSPDGQWIAFWADGEFRKVPIKGGAVATVTAPDQGPFGLVWAPDGRIIFGTEGQGLWAVPAAGGTAAPLTKTDAAREATHRLPHMLPGGRALLMTTMASSMGVVGRIEWLSLDTGKRKVLVEDGADARYVPTGHLVFVRKGVLMAVPFDLARLETTGPAVTVVPHVLQALNSLIPDMNSGSGQYSVSASGALVWAPGDIVRGAPSQFYWVDRGGRAEPWSAFGARTMGGVRISPDGRRFAGTAVGLDRAILLFDSDRNTVTTLTPAGAQGWFNPPFWTPDGKRIVFSWWKTSRPNIWQMATDGSGQMESLASTQTFQRANSLSRDGKYVALVEEGDETGFDIRVLRMADRQVSAFAVTKASEIMPEFAPDGRWLAYVSNESGRNEVYVRSFPAGTRTLQVSADGGTSPVWGPDGRELFFWNVGFTKLMRVAIVPGQNLSAGAPAPLFEFAAARSGTLRVYDIAPDGQRFLIQKWQTTLPAVVTEFNLARNWSGDLKRLSPAGK